MRAWLTLLGALLGVLLLVSVPLSVQDSPYGYYHDRSGTRSALAIHDPFLLHGRIPALDPARDALLVIAPQVPYTDTEVDHVRGFLDAGGHVLVADDDGTGRDLLARLDRGLTISAVSATTPVSNDTGVFLFPTGVLPNLTAPLVWPSPVIVDGDGVPLLVSSPLAWRDLDGDHRADLEEPQGTWAFAQSRLTGKGRLTVVGDPDLIAAPGPISQALLQWHLEGGRRLVLDEGHRLRMDPIGMAPLLAGQASAVVGFGLLATAAAVAVTAWGIRIRRTRRRIRHRPTDPRTRFLLEELS